MSLWRLEVLRLVRTRRWVALLGVYLFFGLVGPPTAAYLSDILEAVGGELEGAVIQLPEPTAADGLAQFVSNAAQLGTLVTLVVAAGALSLDAITEMGVFLRTRTRDAGRLLVPRLVVTLAAASGAWTLGVVAAWYETWVLIGGVAWQDVLAGALMGVVHLVFVVSLVAAVAQWTRSTLSTVLASAAVLLLLPLVGVVDVVGRRLPSRLAGALPDLAGTGAPGDYLGAVASALVASAALFAVAVRASRHHEA